jgi:hypothetical protein
MPNPLKLIKGATKVVKGVTGSRAAKDKKIISKSPFLKETPNMTPKQAKLMKKGTASLAKSSKKIAKKSSKKGSYGSTTVGESNSLKIRYGLDKGFGGINVPGMPSLSTPALGGLKKGVPDNMTLNQLEQLNSIRNAEKAKAYAAAYRQLKREGKSFKKAMESKTTRVVKKTAKGTAVAGSAGAAYAASKKKKKGK